MHGRAATKKCCLMTTPATYFAADALKSRARLNLLPPKVHPQQLADRFGKANKRTCAGIRHFFASTCWGKCCFCLEKCTCCALRACASCRCAKANILATACGAHIAHTSTTFLQILCVFTATSPAQISQQCQRLRFAPTLFMFAKHASDRGWKSTA